MTRIARDVPWLTNEYINQCFLYEPTTGVLTWKVRPRIHFKNDAAHRRWNTQNAGNAAGCADGDGYLKLSVDGQRITGHRLIWAIIHNLDLDDVPDEIDHADTNRMNNREVNLRPATHGQNQHNRARQSNNTSGFKGVSFHRQSGLWRARIRLDYSERSLGLYRTPQEAAAARERAQHMHGEYARLVANDNLVEVAHDPRAN